MGHKRSFRSPLSPTPRPQMLLALGVLVVLSACPKSTTPDAGSPQVVVQDAGLVDDRDPDAGPLDRCVGELECACNADGSCNRGRCVVDTCILCTAGEEACVCEPDGSCDTGFLCNAESVCESCTPGEAGCSCIAGLCGAGLECVADVCEAAACPPGGVGCGCRTDSFPRCDDEMLCLPDETCYDCNADREGCSCIDGACSDGLLCDGNCRAARDCTALVEQGLCDANQLCLERVGEDGFCVPDTCEEGFVLHLGECVPGAPNCQDGAPGSQLEVCTDLFRQCLQGVDAAGVSTAACGNCLGNSTEVNGVCVGRLKCGTAICQETEYCDVTGAEPTCKVLPCAEGAALNSLGVCQGCGFNCSGPGLTGRVWPFRSADSSCVCETEPGFFLQAGGSTRAELCDLDGDGWIREETIDPALLIDGALVANARCGLGAVDSVLLRDEFGISLEVVSCLEGLLIEPDDDECTSIVPLPLVETLRNDTPGPLIPAGLTPLFGSRALFAKEVNGLTKLCVDGLADFNDNGQTDLVEVQPPTLGFDNNPNSGRARLQSFSFFMETHRAYIEVKAGVSKLVIEERRRCDPRDFPLHMASGANSKNTIGHYASDDKSTYWRSCQRGVEPGFDYFNPLPGQDFASWSCDPRQDRPCLPVPPAPPHRRSLTTPTASGFSPPRDATACEIGSFLPGDGVWRGMHHHSQFKCIRVSYSSGAENRAPTAFEGLTAPKLNACGARTCLFGDAGCSASRRVVPGSSAIEPLIDCSVVETVQTGMVGFITEPYRPYGVGFGDPSYNGGCINEDEEFRDRLCPAPVSDADPNWNINPPSEVDGFGRSTCFLGPCPQGRADCDGDPLNGCEIDATTNDACGGCPADPAAKCFAQDGSFPASKHATGQCDSFGFCQIQTCDEGYEDCDGIVGNGCETPTTTLSDCGGCGVICEIAAAEENCSTGECVLGACAVGFADCDREIDNGCEADVSQLNRCGNCLTSCVTQNGVPECILDGAGENYQCAIASCTENFDDCNGLVEDGCESILAADSENCGGCGNQCNDGSAAASHANRACLNGECGFVSCQEGYGNCDINDANGCEVEHFGPDSDNCRYCNDSCATLEETAFVECTETGCELGDCLPGRADCNLRTTDGCEVDLVTAGACGTATDVGSQLADSQCGVICTVDTTETNFHSTTARGSKWFKAKAEDGIGVCSEDLIHKVKLTVPAGVDYDIYVYDACGGEELAKSTSGGIGDDETVTIRRTDGTTGDRSFSYWVEVRWIEGSSCTEYDITFVGRVSC